MMNRWTEKVAPLALGYLHVAVGFEFLVKGLPKIQNPATADRLASGIHFPLIMGWFPTLLEPIGGALLIVGLGTRWLSGYFMAEMFVTGVISKIMIRGVPFVMPNNQPGSGFELDALIFGGAFVLLVFGAGPFALDHLVGAWFKRSPSSAAPPVSVAGASPG